MKKRVLLTVIGALVVSSLCTGCGSTDNEKAQQETTKETASTSTAKQIFPKSAEWDTVPASYIPIQIGDVVVYNGMSVAEIMSKFEDSAVDWKYEYNPEKIILGKKGDELVISSEDGKKWITLYTINPSSDNGSLKDNIVGKIKLERDILKYCRINDGSSFDDLIGLSYEEAKNLGSTHFRVETVSQEDQSRYNGSEEFYIRIIYSYKDTYSAYAATKGYEINAPEYYAFYIDPNTGKIFDIIIGAASFFTFAVK